MSNSVDATEQAFWNRWNASTREQQLDEVSLDQADFAKTWTSTGQGTDLNIIEVGFGAGWMTPILAPFGQVTATDLSDEVLGRAAARWPEVKFVAGDFMALDFEEHCHDVVVTFEVLSHVADQPALCRSFIGCSGQTVC
jgi:2-polyprenyl-3-methyl-5-hydroxy-6-metoxy-1,4-benzoquinol methylase